MRCSYTMTSPKDTSPEEEGAEQDGAEQEESAVEFDCRDRNQTLLRLTVA